VKEEETEEVPAKAKAKVKAVPQGAGAQTLKVALKWVEDVLLLKDKFDSVLRLSFQGDRDLESGMNEVSAYSLRGDMG
jgi:cullin 3